MLVAFSIPARPAGTTAASERCGRRGDPGGAPSGVARQDQCVFTNIEGQWDEVMDVVKRAVDVVAATSPQVGLVLKARHPGSAHRSDHCQSAPDRRTPSPTPPDRHGETGR